MKCNALVSTCRECGKHYGKDKTNPCECGADRSCDKPAVPGYNFCSSHGGPSPSRNFYGRGRGMTTGAGSSFPITRLAAKYNEMKKDGKILSNRHSIEIIRHRVEQLIERIDMNDAPDRLNQLNKLWVKIRDAERGGRPEEATVLKTKMDDLFASAREDWISWEQMFNALELDRKMVESEVKIAKDIQAIITVDEAYKMIAEINAIIISVVNDPIILKRIQYELAKMIGEEPIRKNDIIEAEVIE